MWITPYVLACTLYVYVYFHGVEDLLDCRRLVRLWKKPLRWKQCPIEPRGLLVAPEITITGKPQDRLARGSRQRFFGFDDQLVNVEVRRYCSLSECQLPRFSFCFSLRVMPMEGPTIALAEMWLLPGLWDLLCT